MPRYFLSVLVYFWLPVALMARLLWPRLSGVARRAFWLTIALFYPAAFGMEYVYLHYDIWTFSELKDPLLGLRIWGAPVEEFVFWFGAPPFVMLLYMLVHRRLRRAGWLARGADFVEDMVLASSAETWAMARLNIWFRLRAVAWMRYAAGTWFPWWAVLFLPFLMVLWYLYQATRRLVDWKAAWITVIAFESILFPAEVWSVSRGHWVYNEARIWGPRWLGVPIEEPLLYYLFAPFIVITAMHAVRMALTPNRKP